MCACVCVRERACVRGGEGARTGVDIQMGKGTDVRRLVQYEFRPKKKKLPLGDGQSLPSRHNGLTRPDFSTALLARIGFRGQADLERGGESAMEAKHWHQHANTGTFLSCRKPMGSERACTVGVGPNGKRVGKKGGRAQLGVF